MVMLDVFVADAMGMGGGSPPTCPPCYDSSCTHYLCCEACWGCNTSTNQCSIRRCDQSECKDCNYDDHGNCTGCKSKCNPNYCQTCVGGTCKVCGGDTNQACCDGTCYDKRTQKCCTDVSPKYICEINASCCNGSCCDPTTQKCCNGSCCDKVWTKETHTAIIESCPSVADCYEPGVGCDGTIVKQQQSYDSCLNVGVGSGEHCECNEEEQVVGTKHTCQEDWDWSLMASCALEAVLCAIQCAGAYADPASCADCLAGLELDCCGGDTCHICDFLESCEPLYPEDIKKNVFINFGNCQ